MESAQSLALFLDKNFRFYQSIILCESILNLLVLAFFEYNFVKYDRDLIYWWEAFIQSLIDGNYHIFAVIITFFIIQIVLVSYAYRLSKRDLSKSVLASEAQPIDRQNYATYIYIKLIADIQDIEEKYFSLSHDDCKNRLQDETFYEMETLQTAHKEIQNAIEEFRQNARKVFMLTELEQNFPLDVVFGTDPTNKRLEPFYTKGVQADIAFLRTLLEPG
ncbi:uncharacterized protein LOC119685905 [Teleopsis dalmanni]|uniref:uncharacterized protein LOC119685905 n=1 Tax=Teleopsis dalmanni TaxID=139649 RepID=UPI0018CDBB19|nr:uncharacterized protein LOC119685905 [Teleopsis dalmanni]